MKLLNLIFKRTPPPALNFYTLIGEEEAVYMLVKNFYHIMETDPKARECLLTHKLDEKGEIPDEVKKKLFLFLTGWLGGPNLFVESYGPPQMRRRHGHIKIGKKEASQWLYCMEKALKLNKPSLSRRERHLYLKSFTALALRIQNAS